jgi:hypothetical protein
MIRLVLLLLLLRAGSSLAQHLVTNFRYLDLGEIEEERVLLHPQFFSRTMFMTTLNEGNLKDDYALGQGFGAGLTVWPLKPLAFQMSMLTVYNVFSSELNANDLSTGAPNRYEAGMFDIRKPAEKSDLFRLEEFFVNYFIPDFSVRIGRMKLVTPFLNPQDGRMNSTMEEGAWMNGKNKHGSSYAGGWLWALSPRSTTQWFTVSESFGIYPAGVSEKGLASAYSTHVSSAGIGMLNYNFQKQKYKITVWDMLVENVMNTAMTEVTCSQGKQIKFSEKLMYVHQDAVTGRGGYNESTAYIARNGRSNVISAQAGLTKKNKSITVSYTHITGDGRYLMPREWGRDPFYTFMPREKNDGLGSVNAVVLKLATQDSSETRKCSVSYGFFSLPDVKDFRLNKYGMPSYHQINLELSRKFGNPFRGLELRFVGAWKINAGETYGNARYVYNKVNMANLSVVADFRF